MIEILRKMFEANPGKSSIVKKTKCSQCGCKVSIKITPTSEGFGLQGGTLLKCSHDEYIAQCPACYEVKPRIEDN